MRVSRRRFSDLPRGILFTLGVTSFLWLSCAAGAAESYSVQVGAAAEQAEADTSRTLIAGKFSPVFIDIVSDQSGKPAKLRIGQFGSYAEAYVYKTKLAAVFPGAFIVKCERGEEKLSQNALAVKMPFDTTGADQLDTIDHERIWRLGGFGPNGNAVKAYAAPEPVETMSRDELVQTGKTAPYPNLKGKRALEVLIEQHPWDSEIPTAKLTLARTLARGADQNRAAKLLDEMTTAGPREKTMAKFLRGHLKYNQKQVREALEEFRGCASDTAAPPSMRRKAMRLVAGIEHSMRNYPDAWLAFQQVERCSKNGNEIAEARMQRAGLAYELVLNGKGTWPEFRNLCKTVEDIPDVSRQTLATAALMRLESYYYEANWFDGLAEAESFCATYSDIPREYHVALVWCGIYSHMLGFDDRACELLAKVVTSTIASQDKFAGVEPRARAAMWLAYIADKTGETAKRDANRKILADEYPASEEASHAVALFGQLTGEISE